MSNKTQTGDLNAFFDALAAEDLTPDTDFMAKLEMQALAEMPAAQVDPISVPPVLDASDNRSGLFVKLLDILGGWTGAGGLATACAMGVVIGLNATTGVMAYTATDTDSYTSYGIGMVEEFETAYFSE